jgi:prevent-host-death family protein
MAITAGEARSRFFALIEEVNDDRIAVEIVSRNGSAYLVAAEEYEAMLETAHRLAKASARPGALCSNAARRSCPRPGPAAAAPDPEGR